MAENLKLISSSCSTDLIQHYMDGLDPNERELLTDSLKRMRESLVKKTAKKTKASKSVEKRTDKVIFREDIIPRMQQNLSTYEHQFETMGEVFNVQMNFATNFEGMSLEDKINQHALMMKFETRMEILVNVEHFYRGKLYLSMKVDFQAQPVKSHDSLDAFFVNTVNLKIRTVNRLIQQYYLISNFPRIVVCLTNTEMQLHCADLLKYLEDPSNSDFSSRLKLDFTAITECQTFVIVRNEAAPLIILPYEVSIHSLTRDFHTADQSEEDDPFGLSLEEERALLGPDPEEEISQKMDTQNLSDKKEQLLIDLSSP